MRPLLLTSLLCLLAVSEALTQNVSSNDIQLGVGFGANYNDYFDDLEVSIPHIILSWDKNAIDEVGPGRITAGGFLSFAQYEDEFDVTGSSWIFTYNYLHFGARGGYALYPLANGKIEPYGGLQLVYSYLFYSLEVDGEEQDDIAGDLTGGEVDLTFYLGSRFMLSEGFGAFVELDPLFVTAKFGLVFKKF